MKKTANHRVFLEFHIQMISNGYCIEKYGYSLLKSSGEDVGLPKGQMGNSEVGHLTIGAGRVIFQPLERINKSIKSGEFYNNKELIKVMNHVKETDSKLHIFGLLSDGGVHSHIKHIFSLIDMAKKQGVNKVYLHIFLDGRDTLPNVALKYLDKLKLYILKYKNQFRDLENRQNNEIKNDDSSIIKNNAKEEQNIILNVWMCFKLGK